MAASNCAPKGLNDKYDSWIRGACSLVISTIFFIMTHNDSFALMSHWNDDHFLQQIANILPVELIKKVKSESEMLNKLSSLRVCLVRNLRKVFLKSPVLYQIYYQKITYNSFIINNLSHLLSTNGEINYTGLLNFNDKFWNI